jgi:hypothetical protein
VITVGSFWQLLIGLAGKTKTSPLKNEINVINTDIIKHVPLNFE